MAAVTDVQRLQARVEELERWVYGPGGSRGSRKVSDLGSSGPFWGRVSGLLAGSSGWVGCFRSSPVARSRAFEITKVRDLPEHFGPLEFIPTQGITGYY